MADDDYMTATQARLEMGISTVTLRTMLDTGALPYIDNPRDKRHKLVARSDVDAWKQRNARFPTSKYQRQIKE